MNNKDKRLYEELEGIIASYHSSQVRHDAAGEAIVYTLDDAVQEALQLIQDERREAVEEYKQWVDSRPDILFVHPSLKNDDLLTKGGEE